MIRTLGTKLGAANLNQSAVRTMAWWGNVELGPMDPILGLTELFKKDDNPKKISLAAGTYRDDNGKPYVLNAVRKAERKIVDAKLDKEYAPIKGLSEFFTAAAKLAFGEDSPALTSKRITTLQSLSGTGGLRMGAHLISKFSTFGKDMFMPSPTWGNHGNVFKHAGFNMKSYKYYDPSTKGLNFKGLMDDFSKLKKGSVVLLHACAHNPTGVDPTQEQWKEMSAVLKQQQVFPFFDMAYQGFATGDVDRDAFALRQFVRDGHNMVLTQSFAKNMGMYGERVGAFHCICDSPDEAQRVESQLKILVRAAYSSPPIHGARCAHLVLTDPTLRKEWLTEMKGMADRIMRMRSLLVDELKAVGSKKSWKHVTDQIGMFCFTGMTKPQVERLQKEYSIYLTMDGRISISGITPANVKYLAGAMHEVTK